MKSMEVRPPRRRCDMELGPPTVSRQATTTVKHLGHHQVNKLVSLLNMYLYNKRFLFTGIKNLEIRRRSLMIDVAPY